jgi:2-isopropylmalate synthase
MLAGADTAANNAVKLDFLQVTAGKGVRNVASIGLDIAGQKFEEASSGNGPVDAAIKALKRVIRKQMTLKEFTIQAISKGSDDVGKVHNAGGIRRKHVLRIRRQHRHRNGIGGGLHRLCE